MGGKIYVVGQAVLLGTLMPAVTGVVVADCQTPSSCYIEGRESAQLCIEDPNILTYWDCIDCCFNTMPQWSGNTHYRAGCTSLCQILPDFPPGTNLERVWIDG
jgi:hypothetical protein